MLGNDINDINLLKYEVGLIVKGYIYKVILFLYINRNCFFFMFFFYLKVILLLYININCFFFMFL